MHPPNDPTISDASRNRSEISIPSAPRGGTVNLDSTVTPTSGVASTAKPSGFHRVDARASTAIFSRPDGAARPAEFAIARVRVMSRSLVNHGAEQHRSGRLEL